MTKPTPEELIAWIDSYLFSYELLVPPDNESVVFHKAVRDYIRSTTYDKDKWVLVPKKPTTVMDNCGAMHLDGVDSKILARTIYKTMLAAAPKHTDGDVR